MNTKGILGRCFGSTSVGSKGQMVIPANARKELGIDAGATLLVFDFFQGRALLLLKVDAVERILSQISKRMTGLGKPVKVYRAPPTTSEEKGAD